MTNLDTMYEIDGIKKTSLRETYNKLKNRNPQIFVGTDSQFKDRKIIYVTVVAFKMFRSLISLHKKVIVNCSPKKSEVEMIIPRLMNETIFSFELASYISKFAHVHCVDIDYNTTSTKNNKQNISNKLVGYGLNYSSSHQINCSFKPNIQVATHLADRLCKRNY